MKSNWTRRIKSGSCRILSAIAISMATTLTLAAPTNAEAACAKWDFSQRIEGSHGGYSFIFEGLRQQHSMIIGRGNVGHLGSDPKPPFPDGSRDIEGWVIGVIKGNRFELTAPSGGVYVGEIDATGRTSGYAYDPRALGVRQAWASNNKVRCLSAIENPPVPAEALTGQGACKIGFTPRLAAPTDLTCVTAQSRARVIDENFLAVTRRNRWDHTYGGATCAAGFVWRAGIASDLVCVTPAVRDLVAAENRRAASRVRVR